MPSHLWTVTDKAGNVATRTVNYTVTTPTVTTKIGSNLANPILAAVNPLEVFRHYFQPGDFTGSGQPTWTNESAIQAAWAKGCRTFVISVKDLMNAKVDAFLATIPAGVKIYGSYFHEHEGNIRAGEFTAAQYRARFATMSAAWRARGFEFGPIHNGLNRNAADTAWIWGNYVEPDPGDCTYWGTDCYDPNNKGVSLFDTWLAYAQGLGLPIVIGETACPQGPGQAAWGAAMRQWSISNGLAVSLWWHQQFSGKPNYVMQTDTQHAWFNV
jgi:hypothetical protein